ncbi:hypothetical protein GO497_12445 [Acidovorax citrulli]|nr:hypothetical protein [Paracidovorax citrulli]
MNRSRSHSIALCPMPRSALGEFRRPHRLQSRVHLFQARAGQVAHRSGNGHVEQGHGRCPRQHAGGVLLDEIVRGVVGRQHRDHHEAEPRERLELVERIAARDVGIAGVGDHQGHGERRVGRQVHHPDLVGVHQAGRGRADGTGEGRQGVFRDAFGFLGLLLGFVGGRGGLLGQARGMQHAFQVGGDGQERIRDQRQLLAGDRAELLAVALGQEAGLGVGDGLLVGAGQVQRLREGGARLDGGFAGGLHGLVRAACAVCGRFRRLCREAGCLLQTGAGCGELRIRHAVADAVGDLPHLPCPGTRGTAPWWTPCRRPR